MQASVHTFDEDSHGGTALLDDGREVTFDPVVFAESALRHLRTGQRVSVVLAPDGRTVTRLWVIGIGPGELVR